jgi:hypothetical protein
MIKKIIVTIIVLIVALLAFAATRPDAFRIQRTTRINAAPDRIYANLEDFHRWTAWSPWEKMDPAMRRTHSGAPKGVGAVYEWEGNSKVGKGRMEIVKASAPSVLTVKLDFLKPFEAHNYAEFTLRRVGASTDVTWSMFGPSPYASKVMGIFFDMDRMVGTDFENGLANLKTVAEQ